MSLKIKVYNQAAEPIKDLELNEAIFAVEASNELIHQAMVAQTANSRQVLAHTKGRSEVRGGGKKPWKQKGTGRARRNRR
jgi:large subunit ribosomal protein L4